jgi:hypothetical protein
VAVFLRKDMLDPRTNQNEFERRINNIMLCGKNGGRHYYEPVSWVKSETDEYVSMFMCMVCFNRVSAKTLYEQFPEARMEG